jgi:orotate phosphoribosyltransferase
MISKSDIYKYILETKTLYIKDFITHGNNKPYSLNINNSLSNAILFDNITLLIENSINKENIKFDKICACSVSAIPYATNVATSYEKSICYVNDTGNMRNIEGDLKNIKFEGGFQIDDNILLIETIVDNTFYLENIITKIRKYGGNIAGIIILINQCEGEYSNLLYNNEHIIPIINLYDIFAYLENNNQIEMFYCEKIKFYCEKITKENIKKLIQTKNNIPE